MSVCTGMGEDEVSQVIDLLYMALQLKGMVFQMLQLVVTVKIDLTSTHGTDIPRSVSFQDDNIISTVSTHIHILLLYYVFDGRVRFVEFNCG